MAKDTQKNKGASIQELKAAIRDGNFARLYIFHGEETFLLNHGMDEEP